MLSLNLQEHLDNSQRYFFNKNKDLKVSYNNTNLNYNDVLQLLNASETFEATLPNGLKVVYRQTHSPLVKVQCIFDVGFRDDGNLPGLSHLTEHMAFRGTEDRTVQDIWSKFVFSGYGNAYTAYALTGFYCFTRKNDYSDIVKVMVDMFSNSILPNLETEKKIVAHELDLYIDNTQNRLFNTIFTNALGINLCDSSTQKQYLPKITPKDVKDHMEKYYVPSNAKLLIEGNAGNRESVFKTLDALTSKWGPIQTKSDDNSQKDPKVYVDALQKNLENLKTSDVALRAYPKVEYKPGLYKYAMNNETAHCALLFKGSPCNHENIQNYVKDNILLHLICQNYVEGNMTNTARHEQGLTYTGLRPFSETDVDFGLWGLYSHTDKKSVPELLKTMAKELGQVKSRINNKNVDEAISNTKYFVYDSELRNLGVSMDDFRLVADSITVKEMKSYFDSSIASKCTIAIAGGFEDAPLNNALYSEVNTILAHL